MSAPEIIDFFSDENVEPSMLNKDFSAFSDEENKKTTPTPKKEKNEFNYSDNNDNLSINDKVVWVTAIFVFFGIMVFLLGYWLGKTSIKQLFLSEREVISQKEKKLEEKKVENFVIASSTSTADTPIVIQSPEVTEKISQPKESVAEKIPEIKVEKKEVEKPKVDTTGSKVLTFPEKTVKKENATPGEKIQKVTPTTKKEVAKELNYSIQVSAHTSMEKARAVEEDLRSLGVYSYLVEANVNGVTYYRVRVGKFSTKEEAEATLKRVKSSKYGKDSFIINLN
ncbi:MAG: SPOR domain-containing protein [Brevinematia bacterium]